MKKIRKFDLLNRKSEDLLKMTDKGFIKIMKDLHSYYGSIEDSDKVKYRLKKLNS